MINKNLLSQTIQKRGKKSRDELVNLPPYDKIQIIKKTWDVCCMSGDPKKCNKCPLQCVVDCLHFQKVLIQDVENTLLRLYYGKQEKDDVNP